MSEGAPETPIPLEKQARILKEQEPNEAYKLEALPGYKPDWKEWFVAPNGEVDYQKLADYIKNRENGEKSQTNKESTSSEE